MVPQSNCPIKKEFGKILKRRWIKEVFIEDYTNSIVGDYIQELKITGSITFLVQKKREGF